MKKKIGNLYGKPIVVNTSSDNINSNEYLYKEYRGLAFLPKIVGGVIQKIEDIIYSPVRKLNASEEETPIDKILSEKEELKKANENLQNKINNYIPIEYKVYKEDSQSYKKNVSTDFKGPSVINKGDSILFYYTGIEDAKSVQIVETNNQKVIYDITNIDNNSSCYYSNKGIENGITVIVTI